MSSLSWPTDSCGGMWLKRGEPELVGSFGSKTPLPDWCVSRFCETMHKVKPWRILSLLLAVSFFFVAGPSHAGCDDPFSDPDDIVDFHLHLSTADWSSLQESERSSADCDGQFPYVELGFSCGEEEPISIGVRRRRDRTETKQKLPLKLDFNRFVKGQRWPTAMGALGFRRLSLNSGQPDDAAGLDSNGPGSNTGLQSTLLTEHLAWRIMGEELPEVGGVAYARLTLHFEDTGESRFQGIYVLIEDIDRTAIKRRFTASEGALYKTTRPECVDKVVFDDGPPNNTKEAFDEWHSLDPNDFSGAWGERSNQSVYLDGLLRQEAVRELFANEADTILGTGNNVVTLDLYDAKRLYLPWDLDDMFRPQPQIRDPFTPLIVACGGGESQCTWSTPGLLTRANEELRPHYLEILCQMTNGVGREEKVLAEFNALDERVRPILAEEVPVLWEPEGLDPLDASILGTYAAEVERMQTWIPERIQAVRQLITDEGVVCEKGCEEGAVATCDFFGCPSQRSCVGGVWGACEATEGYVPGSLDIDCDGVPEAQPFDPNGSSTGGAAGMDPDLETGGTMNAMGDGGSSSDNLGGAPAGGANTGGNLGNEQGEGLGGEAPIGSGGSEPGDDPPVHWALEEQSGCGCKTGPRRLGGASLSLSMLVLLVLGLRRRERLSISG